MNGKKSWLAYASNVESPRVNRGFVFAFIGKGLILGLFGNEYMSRGRRGQRPV